MRDRVHAKYFAAIGKATSDLTWADQTSAVPKTVQVDRDMVRRVVDTSPARPGKPLNPALVDGSFVSTDGDAAQT